MSESSILEIPSSNCLVCNERITETINLNQSEGEQRDKRKLLVKSKRTEKKIEPCIKKQKITEDIVDNHTKNMESEVYKSLFTKNHIDETYSCRNLKAGLR